MFTKKYLLTTSETYATTHFSIKGQTFILHPLKAIFWKEEQTLILADLHLGKSQHFRKNGLAVPTQISQSNFDKLLLLIKTYNPKEVLILGDLFHSDHNIIWDLFCSFCNQFEAITFSLVPGNHDILSGDIYQKSPLKLLEVVEERGPFLFSHHPIDDLTEHLYNIYGHIHPGIQMRGKGRQSLRLPCYYFGTKEAVVPAFGAFTGLHVIHPLQGDQVFAIVENEIISLPCI